MKEKIPEKLKIGDEIRVIAPSRSMKILNQELIEAAKKELEDLGFKVTFGKNVFECDDIYKCATIESRVEDLNEAFLDKNVKAIITVIGGYNVNQILSYINYENIKQNPKILCGFSDITALTNAIYTKTGLVTYSGPHFSSFGMKEGLDYTIEYFKKIFMNNEEIEIKASKKWSNDAWYKNQREREFIRNEGMFVINEGEAKGKIIGGNLCTLNLLQGTEYMPDLDTTILFLEDDGLVEKEFMKEFDRNLQSLLHCSKNKNINGIVIGRAEKICEMNNEKWIKLIKSKKELANIPIIAGADFGHTTPIFTFPIGGTASIKAFNNKIEIKIKEFGDEISLDKRNSYNYIGKTVTVKIDRPIGSSHPKYTDHIYLTNYGYVPNTISGDSEELDCYILGEYKPLKEYTGKCIAVIHRINDDDDKLIIVQDGKEYTDNEIRLLTEYQEKYFNSEIIR